MYLAHRGRNVIEKKGCYWKRRVTRDSGRVLSPYLMMDALVVGQFAVAALSERRNSLRIQDRRSETAATKTKLTHYRQQHANNREERPKRSKGRGASGALD